MSRRRALVFGAAFVFVASPALASSEDAAAAEKLFHDARARIEAGDPAAACPLFAESQRLDPAVGTLLNLAECYEAIGRTASAWATYEDMATLASRKGQALRADHATAKAHELEPALPYLTVTVPGAANVHALTVSRDDTALSAALWGHEVPVDPGRHHLVVRAPGHVDWDAWLELHPGEHRAVVVPALVANAALPAPDVDHGRSVGRPIAAVALGLGAAGVVAGLFLGGVAWSTDATARRDHCSATDCTARGVELQARASDYATAATISFFVGLGVAAVGVVALLLAPPAKRAALARWEVLF